MGSTVTPADLTVTVTTNVVLNGQPKTTENQLIVEDVNEYDSRIMTIPSTSEVTVMNFASAVAAGTFIRGEVKHLQITNLDAVNYARIRVQKTSSYGFDIRLDPGKIFMMGNAKEYASQTGATFVAFADADYISAQADTSPVDIEYVVASVS